MQLGPANAMDIIECAKVERKIKKLKDAGIFESINIEECLKEEDSDTIELSNTSCPPPAPNALNFEYVPLTIPQSYLSKPKPDFTDFINSIYAQQPIDFSSVIKHNEAAKKAN